MSSNFLRVEISAKRIFGLDILRAVAILFVVVGHGQYLLPSSFKTFHRIFVFDGVSIFFVLSGFLIGGILIKIIEKEEATKKVLFDFWIRRWFRTLPNYFLMLFIIMGYFLLTSEGFSVFNVKRYFIFSQNLFYEHPSFFPEAWSLSVEEWFYLLMPSSIFILISFFKMKPRNSVLVIAISVLLMVTLFRVYRYSTIEIESIRDWDIFFRKQVITRLDSLMFGVLGAYIQYYNPRKWFKFKLPLLILGLFLFVITKLLSILGIFVVSSFYNCVFSFTVISFATLLLLPYLSELKSGSGVVYKGVTIISLISYSMYLLNLSVVQEIIIKSICWDVLPEFPYLIVFLKYIFYWIFTVFASILIYKYYEVPLTALRDKKWS